MGNTKTINNKKINKKHRNCYKNGKKSELSKKNMKFEISISREEKEISTDIVCIRVWRTKDGRGRHGRFIVRLFYLNHAGNFWSQMAKKYHRGNLNCHHPFPQ